MLDYMLPRLSHYFFTSIFKIRLFVESYISRVYFFYWGILGSSNLQCIGLPIVRLRPGSRVEIGDRCKFISSSAGNYWGIKHRCIIATMNPDSNLRIGDNSGFSGVTIACEKEIIIGNNVRCGANSVIADTDWHSDDPRVSGPKSVLIGDNVWLGAEVIVLKGVTIGENSVVGAGSIVTKSIPANVFAAGNPAKIVKKMDI